VERFEQPQCAPQLGQRRAAITQERVERPRAVAVADQGLAEIGVAIGMAREQLGLDPLGPLEPPGGAGDARGEHGLERARRRQLFHQRRLERLEFFAVLAGDNHEFLCPQAVLQSVLGGARLAFRRFGAARVGAVAPARRGAGGAQERRQRGMVCGAAAPGAALGLDMTGFLGGEGRPKRGPGDGARTRRTQSNRS
jgi:hypothetical protein